MRRPARRRPAPAGSRIVATCLPRAMPTSSRRNRFAHRPAGGRVRHPGRLRNHASV